MPPLVSVCIPAYCQPELLKKALNSLLVQTFTDFEVIVTDDSPDARVEELIRAFDFGGRLNYFRNQVALGSPENWNEAVRQARGEYIKMLHHDDWFTAADALSRIVRRLEERPEANFAFAASTTVDTGDGSIRRITEPSPGQLARLSREPEILVTGNFLGVPSATLYRRRVNKGYDPCLKWLVDLDFYTAVIRANPNVAYEPAQLVAVGHLPSQITATALRNKGLLLFEYFYFAEKWALDLSRPEYKEFYGRLIARLKVQSTDEIRGAGFGGRLPAGVDELIRNRWMYALKNKMQYYPIYLKHKLLGKKLPWQ